SSSLSASSSTDAIPAAPPTAPPAGAPAPLPTTTYEVVSIVSGEVITLRRKQRTIVSVAAPFVRASAPAQRFRPKWPTQTERIKRLIALQIKLTEPPFKRKRLNRERAAFIARRREERSKLINTQGYPVRYPFIDGRNMYHSYAKHKPSDLT